MLRPSRHTGFTLIEMLVVIAIIGILASILMTSLFAARAEGQKGAALRQLSAIRTAINLLEVDTGEWPCHQPANTSYVNAPPPTAICTSSGSNEAYDLTLPQVGLVANDTSIPYTAWQGPYITSIPLDPWGRPYFFDTDYYVQPNGTPCNQGSPWTGCSQAVAVGSYGPTYSEPNNGHQFYGSDDIIILLTR